MFDVYKHGPVAGLADMGEEGWNSLDLSFIRHLGSFVAANCEISSVQAVVYDSLISGDIIIRTSADIDKEQKEVAKHAAESTPPKPIKPGMERANKSEPLVPLTAREEAAQRTRSVMWARFAIECKKQQDLIGFCCCTYAPNTPENALIMDTDPKRPCVLQLDRLTRVMHRVDVLGTHEFRFFTRGIDPMTEIEVPHVKVIGSEMPDVAGKLSSKMIRLYRGPWEIYHDMVQNMRRADRERANPTLVTVEDGAAAHRNSDPQMITSYTGINDLATPAPQNLTPMQAAQANAVADAVFMRNCASSCEPMQAAAAAAANPRKRKERSSEGGFTEYEVTPGRTIASNHMPEPPANPLPWKLAVLESVCIMYKLPMSMLTNGDATGKQKLNANNSVSSQMSRIFLEAQASLRRDIECIISGMYAHMYRADKLLGLINHKLKSSQGKEGPTLAEMNEMAIVIVNVTGTVEPELLQALFTSGVVRYPPYARHMAHYSQILQSEFERLPIIPVEDLAGVPAVSPAEPTEAGAPAGAGASKKKNKKKNKKAKTGSN